MGRSARAIGGKNLKKVGPGVGVKAVKMRRGREKFELAWRSRHAGRELVRQPAGFATLTCYTNLPLA
jgi:hypothetical protein